MKKALFLILVCMLFIQCEQPTDSFDDYEFVSEDTTMPNMYEWTKLTEDQTDHKTILKIIDDYGEGNFKPDYYTFFYYDNKTKAVIIRKDESDNFNISDYVKAQS